MRRHGVLIAFLAAVLVSQTPRVASADPNPATAAPGEASRCFRRGVEFFNDKNYSAALVQFRRAYEIDPNFSVLYNIGQIQYITHDYASALATFEKYLADGGGKVPPARRREVEQDIAHLHELVAYVEVSTNATSGDVTVDEVVVASLPVTAPIVVSAGRRRIALRSAGRDLTSEQVDLAAGDHLRVALNVEPPAPPPSPPSAPPAPPPPPQRHGPPWPVIAWAGAGVLASATTVTGILALRASSQLSDDRAMTGVTRVTLDSDQGKTKTLALVTDLLGVATAATAGLALYLTLRTRSSGEVRMDVGASSIAMSVVW